MQTDLTVEVLNKIEGLVEKANRKDNLVLDVDGKHFKASSLEPLIVDYRPGTLEVSSLSAIATYVKDKLESIDPSKLFLRIVSPAAVELLEEFSGEKSVRTCYLKAGLQNDAEPFEFGSFMDSESFIIGLMSVFEETADRAKVIEFASGLVAESKLMKTDTGGTTKVQANQGVVSTSGATDPGVVVLKPFRTFRQIPQPQSAFIFRYRAHGDEIELALIEADGGAWKHEAMKNIAEYFANEVPELKVLA